MTGVLSEQFQSLHLSMHAINILVIPVDRTYIVLTMLLCVSTVNKINLTQYIYVYICLRKMI